MAKKSTKSSEKSPSKANSKAASKPTSRPKKSASPENRYADIDQASVSALIYHTVASKRRGVSGEALKKGLVGRFSRALDYNLKTLKGARVLRIKDDHVTAADDGSLIRRAVCNAFWRARDQKLPDNLLVSTLTPLARPDFPNLTDGDVYFALKRLCEGTGCVIDNRDGTFSRNWNVDHCPCD